MIPFGSRVGIGAIGAGVAAASGAVPVALLLALVAAGTSVVACLARSPRRGASARRASIGVLAGAWLVILRLAVAPAGPEAAALPSGAGPWTARVTTLSAPRDGQQRLTVTLDEPYGVVLAVTSPRYPVVEPGDLVRLAGRAAAPPESGYGDFLRRTGVTGTLRTSALELVAHADDPAGLLERTRRAAGDALTRALPEPAAGLAAGILVGLRDRVDRDLAAAFTATGLSHVVAISGWNIALVAGLVGAVLAGRARRTRSGAIVVAIAVYAVLAGASPSVVRAAAMTCVALLARESGRPGTAAAALGWAVALLVVVNPASAVDIGLQLSAAATAGLIAWSAPIAAALERRAGWIPRWIREGLGVSLAAQAATLPLVLFAFGRVAPLSPITNLAVVPLVPLVMAAGAVALAGGAAAALGAPGVLASLLGIPGALVLGLLIGIVRLAARLPFANVTLPPAVAAAAAALTLAALLAFVTRGRMRRAWNGHRTTAEARPTLTAPRPGGDRRRARTLRLAGLLGALAIAVLVVAGATRPDGRAHVIVLDVGQGDAILVTGPTGGRMLVDGGPDPDRLLVALDARVPPWDRRIDLLVLTHPHEDHVAGLPLVLERYRVGQVAEAGMPGRSPGYEALSTILPAHGAASGRLVAGDHLTLDGIALDVIWPDADRVPRVASDDGSEVNDASIVLLGTFEGRRFLLMGDAEADVEAELLVRGLPTVDLLKAGHHGSRTSTTAALVEATHPRVAAVSVGVRNDYGHPSREVLARLAGAGAAVLRTDQVGAIDVALGGAGIEVRTERPVHREDTGAVVAARRPGADREPGGPAGLPYDRRDARPVARGRRRPPPLARAARLAHPPCAGRRRGGGLARRPMRGQRDRRRPGARGGGRAPPRRGQGGPRDGRGCRPPPRRRVGRLARRAGHGRARAGRGGAPGHPPPRALGRCVAAVRAGRGDPRCLRRQARRPAAGADGRAVCRLAAALPRRVVGGRRRPGTHPGAGARSGRVCPRRGCSGDGRAPALDRAGVPDRPARGRGAPAVTSTTLGYYWGDDEYGLDAAALALGRRAAGPGGEPPATWRTTGATTKVGDIAERVSTATLFGGGTLVIVEEPGPLVRAKADREALLATVSTLAPGNALAFVESVDGSARRATSLEDLATAVADLGGEVRHLAAPREGGMARWIEDRASERGMRLERGAAEALARKIGAFVREGDVDRRRQGRLAVAELEKLAVYRLDEPIRADDVDALVADAVPGSTWAFVDAVGSRSAREAAGLLDRLFETTPEPVLVAVLHRRIRELLLVADHRERGESIQATARALKLKEYPARKLWEQGLAWREDELVGALEGLLELDAGLKGERGSDARRRRLAFSLWLAERVARL